MAVVLTVPISGFIGSHSLPARNIPDGRTVMTVAFDGSTMLDPACSVALSIETSPDGGTTWAFLAGVDFTCGDTDKHGQPIAVYGRTIGLPPGTGRQIRGTFVVTGAALTTTATVDLS